MKKIIAGILSIFMTVGALSSCALFEEDIGGQLSVGMDNQAFLDIADDQRGFLEYGPYVFFANAGNNYVALLDYETEKVKLLYAFESVMPMNEDFSKIQEGDDVFTVVELVGLPMGSYTSGFKTLSFKSRSGKIFTVYLDGEDKVAMVLGTEAPKDSSDAGDSSEEGSESASENSGNSSEDSSSVIEGDYSTYTMTASIDYMYIENQATVLLNGCNVFFNLSDYDLQAIVAGDILKMYYEGQFVVQETYPGTVLTDYFTLVDVVVEEAFFIPLTVEKLPDGNLSYSLQNYTVSKFVSSNIISKNGSFRAPTQEDIGKTFYASCKGHQKGFTKVQVEAIYDYLPREDDLVHTCVLGESTSVAPTCREEGYDVGPCMYCGEECKVITTEKIPCEYDENDACRMCGGFRGAACWECGEPENTYRKVYDVYLCDACYNLWQQTEMQPCCYCGLYTCTGCVGEE